MHLASILFVDVGALTHQGLVWGPLLLLVLVSFGFIFQLGVGEECNDLDFSPKSNQVFLLYYTYMLFGSFHVCTRDASIELRKLWAAVFEGIKHRVSHLEPRKRLVSKGEKEWASV